MLGHVWRDRGLDAKRPPVCCGYQALPEAGAVVVYEALIDDGRQENAAGLLTSLTMLIETPDGFDFTGADCRGWMAAAIGAVRPPAVSALTGNRKMD